MKKTTKRIISLILSIILIISCTVPSFAYAKEEENEIRRSLSITVSTDEESYKRKETVTLHVTVKNNSENNYEDVKVNMAFNNFKLDSAEGSAIVIDLLKSGESKTIDFNVNYAKLSFGARIVFRLFKNISWVFRTTLGFHPETVRDYVWLGGVKYLFVFYVTGGEIVTDGSEENFDNTDSDGDGIPDCVELEYGTDSYSNDTDGDGLSDYWEFSWLNLDPTKNDTDSNGVTDDQEDTDGDSIKNIDEIKYGTNPALKDTDVDRLSDYEEIFVYKTDPTKEDTDGDGIVDGDEILNGTDPLTPEKTFVSEEDLGEPTEDIPVVVSAKAIGDAESAGTLEIEYIPEGSDPRLSKTIPGYLGYAYNFSIEGTMTSAEITFTYDESLGKISDNFQPRIYYFNEANGTLEELENQKVTNGSVTANVTHFSTYILLNKVEFDMVWETEIKPVDYKGDGKTGIDIVFVIDSSGSMTGNDSTDLRKTVVKNFVDRLGENDRAAIVEFDSSAYVYQNFTSDHDSLYTAVDKVDSSGGTSLSAGMSVAVNLFTNDDYSRTDGYKYIVFLTDGGGDYSTTYSTKAVDNNIIVYTIGLGNGVYENVLKKIAETTSGKYYFASTAMTLPDIYEEISHETVDYTTDSNNDGISDYYTKLLCDGKLVLSTGSKILQGTDLNYDMNGNLSDDFDGDGLKNGEEIKVTTLGNKVYVEMISNPLINDSDNDGYSDYAEIKKMNTSPLDITQKVAPLEALMNNNSYVYYEMITDDSIRNSIRGWVVKNLYWSKTKDSKSKMIEYFYDYTSKDTLDTTAEARAKILQNEKYWDTIETMVDVISTLKNVVDAGTKAGSDTSEVKKLLEDCEKAKKTSIKECNEKSEKIAENIKSLSSILKVVSASEKTITDIAEVAEKKGFGEIVGATKTITGLVAKSVSLAKKVNSKWVLPLPNSLAKFSTKYQKWMENKSLGTTNATKVGAVFDIVDLGVEIADLKNTYAKIQANTQAFEQNIELIEYIAQNGNDETYIKTAASELMEIVLDKSWDTYYKKLDAAIGKEGLRTLASVAFDILGDACPYVEAAIVIYDVVSFMGVTAAGESIVYLEVIDAISDGSIDILKNKIVCTDLFFDHIADDTYLYLVQLAQSRIVGEKGVYDYLTQNNMRAWIERKLGKLEGKEVDKTFAAILNGIYGYADKLELTLSDELPIYEKGWTTLGKASGVSGSAGGGFR